MAPRHDIGCSTKSTVVDGYEIHLNTPGRSSSVIGLLSAITLVLALLRFLPVSTMGPEVAAIAIVGLAWLIYQFLEPLCLLHQHALLREIFRPESWLRRWLWKGFLLRVAVVFGSISAAGIALITADAMNQYEWMILLASMPLFALALGVARRRLVAHCEDRYNLILALGTAYGITLVLMIVALMSWQFFAVEVPATAHMAWHEVLREAYMAKATSAAIPQIGWLLGVNAVLSDGVWHLMQILRADSGDGRVLYFALCIALLGWMAVKLASIWLVLLGVFAAAFRRRMPRSVTIRRGAPSQPFLAVIALLLVIVVGMKDANLSIDRAFGIWSGLQYQVVPGKAVVDPCEELRAREHYEITQAVAREIDGEHRELDARIFRMIDQRVDIVFARAEQGVEAFLDWTFSVEGQYEQLAFLAISAVGSRTLESFIAAKVDERVHAVIQPGLEQLSGSMQNELTNAIESIYRRNDAFVLQLIEQANCLELPRPAVALENYMHKSLVGAGAGAGIISARVVNRTGLKMVGQGAMKRVLTATAAKGATRGASAGKSSLFGLACGPFAPFCMAGFGLAAWFGTDYVINAVDEALHRDELRAEMLGALGAEKESFKHQLREVYLDASNELFQDVREYQAARFNIYRDGG